MTLGVFQELTEPKVRTRCSGVAEAARVYTARALPSIK